MMVWLEVEVPAFEELDNLFMTNFKVKSKGNMVVKGIIEFKIKRKHKIQFLLM